MNLEWRLLANYVGQLRAYSYADLLLLLAATNAPIRHILGASALWFGFLIHLEWRHRDRHRALWPWQIWVVLWALGLALLPGWPSVMFIVLSATYALKKRFPGIAYISFLYNGGLKVMLVMDIGQRWPVLLAIGLLMTLRNLMGDVRDAGKDVSEGVRSLPVAMGLRRNVPYVYPAALAITSTIWTIYGHLPIWTLVLALIVQATTYKLTPR